MRRSQTSATLFEALFDNTAAWRKATAQLSRNCKITAGVAAKAIGTKLASSHKCEFSRIAKTTLDYTNRTMKLINYAAALAALGMAASTAQAGNITIVNGDFGSPFVGGNFNTYFATDSTSIPGWTLTGGSIDLIGNYWQSSPGNGSGQSVDMDGYFAAGTIQQSGIFLDAGTATVSFDLAGNTDGGSPIKTLQVDLLGLAPQVFTFDTTGHGHGNMGWVSESATFIVPTAGNYTLQFASLDYSGSAYGPALDNVSMNETQATPEGASTAMLFGISLAALAAFRRKPA